MNTILEASSVDQFFRTGFWLKPVQVLDKVDLKVPRGTVFGFLGANGAGKTTLIHLITGLRKPTRGTVRVLGHDACSPMAKAQIGYLPERPYFQEHLTGRGLLEYFGTLAGMRRPTIKDRIPIVLKLVNLDYADKLELKKYSKGMLQRIGIAQALLHNPELLVLDEPMSGLDPIGRKEMRELILNLATEGHTIFFSSHVIPDVEAICRQVALIDKGKILGCGPIDSFLQPHSEAIEVAFSGIKINFPEFQTVTEIPKGLRAIVPNQKALDGVITKILAQDGHILWVQPLRPSLEDLFKPKAELQKQPINPHHLRA